MHVALRHQSSTGFTFGNEDDSYTGRWNVPPPYKLLEGLYLFRHGTHERIVAHESAFALVTDSFHWEFKAIVAVGLDIVDAKECDERPLFVHDPFRFEERFFKQCCIKFIVECKT